MVLCSSENSCSDNMWQYVPRMSQATVTAAALESPPTSKIQASSGDIHFTSWGTGAFCLRLDRATWILSSVSLSSTCPVAFRGTQTTCLQRQSNLSSTYREDKSHEWCTGSSPGSVHPVHPGFPPSADWFVKPLYSWGAWCTNWQNGGAHAAAGGD